MYNTLDKNDPFLTSLIGCLYQSNSPVLEDRVVVMIDCVFVS